MGTKEIEFFALDKFSSLFEKLSYSFHLEKDEFVLNFDDEIISWNNNFNHDIKDFFIFGKISMEIQHPNEELRRINPKFMLSYNLHHIKTLLEILSTVDKSKFFHLNEIL